MRLYIKQKVFSWNDKFTVKDEYGVDRYSVEGEFFSIGRKLHIRDMYGNEVAAIHQKVLSWLACYNVFIQGEHMADVKQKFSLLRPKFEIDGPGWTMEGSFWEHDYEVSDSAGNSVVRISKEWMSWGDSYELDIADPADELLALAIVLTIDCVKDSQNNN